MDESNADLWAVVGHNSRRGGLHDRIDNGNARSGRGPRCATEGTVLSKAMAIRMRVHAIMANCQSERMPARRHESGRNKSALNEHDQQQAEDQPALPSPVESHSHGERIVQLAASLRNGT